MNRLDGRVAIVTGAGQGIGHSVALCLARAGAHIVVSEVVQERIPRTVADVEALGVQALGVQGNITRADDVDRPVRPQRLRHRRAGAGAPRVTRGLIRRRPSARRSCS